jgi:choline transport protein
VLNSPIIELPLAAIYLQATNSRAGTTGLLVIFLINLLVTIPGAYVTCGRMLWTLARDDATPFSGIVGRVSPTHRNPFNATFVCGCCCTILGCIYIGNQTAFNAFVGCFAILTTMSYLAAILPHILFRRKYVKPGPFWMPGPWGYIVTGISSAYIIVFNIIYCFPYAMPVNAASMNYSCLMSGGLTIFVSVWYLWKRDHGYMGPHVLLEANNEVTKGIVGIPVTEGREGTSVLRGSMHSAKHSQGVHEANEATMVG